MLFSVISESDELLCIGLCGEIDHHTAAQISAGIDEIILRVLPKKLVLDFGAVTFMDSSGIGLVMGRYRLLQPFGGSVELANVPTLLQKVMHLAGLDRLTAPQKGEKENESD